MCTYSRSRAIGSRFWSESWLGLEAQHRCGIRLTICFRDRATTFVSLNSCLNGSRYALTIPLDTEAPLSCNLASVLLLSRRRHQNLAGRESHSELSEPSHLFVSPHLLLALVSMLLILHHPVRTKEQRVEVSF
jgi:hypothetical protein